MIYIMDGGKFGFNERRETKEGIIRFIEHELIKVDLRVFMA